MLHLHRELIRLRREHPSLQGRSYAPAWGDKHVLAFYRGEGEHSFFVAANLSGAAQQAVLEGSGNILVSTTMKRTGPVCGSVPLAPNEAVLIKLDKLSSHLA